MQPKPLHVLGIGVCAVDDILYVPAYPPLDTKTPITSSARYPGGLTATAMATIGSLGGACAYAANLDHFDLSSFIQKSLEDKNVQLLPQGATGQPFHSIIVVEENSGKRTILYDSSKFVVIPTIPDTLLASASVLFLDYLVGDPMTSIARQARRLNIPIVADLEGKSAACLELLPLIDHLIVSADFAQWQTGLSDPALSCQKLAQTCRAATIVTAGEDGSYLIEQSNPAPQHIPAFPVKTLNTNGCGDVFHGAYALAIAKQMPPHSATLYASAAAAIKASTQGAWSALPTAKTLTQFLHRHNTHFPQ